MKFTDIFIRRPVLAIVVNLIIIIAGLQAVRGGDDGAQAAGGGFRGGQDLGGQGAAREGQRACGDVGLGQPCVGHHHPAL